MPRSPSVQTAESVRGATCTVCGQTLKRKADMPRHMKNHSQIKEKYMHECPYPGCGHKTLQKSNMATHIRIHTGEKPFICPDEECSFRTGDPGSLTRHRKRKHGYVAGQDKTTVVSPQAPVASSSSAHVTLSSTDSAPDSPTDEYSSSDETIFPVESDSE